MLRKPVFKKWNAVKVMITFSVLFLLTVYPAFAQSISGVINTYAKVNSISGTTLTLTNVAGAGSLSNFDPGSKVLVIQMKGATINTSNDEDYGDIISYGNAGNYEFTTVASRLGPIVTLNSLNRNFDAAGLVQIIAYTEYANPTVTGTVTAIDWDAALGRGGVIVVSATGNLSLSANIDASLQGFEGGRVSNNKNGSCSSSHPYYTSSTDYGVKGEGVVITPSTNRSRGKLASGGGGAAPKNAGGGGGGNYTAGGNGGYGRNCTASSNGGGLGGTALSYAPSLNKVFLGGGGGGGQANNGQATDGSNGGGIVFVFADTLKTDCVSNWGIYSDGGSSLDSNNEGAGGGGAGGTISLTINAFDTETCSIELLANGGDGGDVDHTNFHGAGGGGGIGAILVNIPLPDSVDVASVPGTAGLDCKTCGSTGTDGGGCPIDCSITNSTERPFMSCNNDITATANPGDCSTIVNYTQLFALDSVSTTISEFTYDYDTSYWDANHYGDGSIDFINLTRQIAITSANDNTTNAASDYCIYVPATGTVSFDWDYSTTDSDPDDDLFGYYLNGTFNRLTSSSGTTQSGTVNVSVQEGDHFCFSQESTDGQNGAATTTISNFSGSGYQVPVVLNSGLASGSSFPIGTTVVQYIATYDSGSEDTCSFNVVVSGSCPSLPVELIYFIGEEQNCDVLIQWATQTEENASHFEVQRSNNGIDFEKIAELSAIGHSTRTEYYDYLDTEVNTQDNYYRLKQIDLDGTFEYSEIILIKVNCFDQSVKDVNIYPNPLFYNNEINVTFNSIVTDQEVEVKIYDARGVIVLLQKISVNEGYNAISLSIGELPAANYFLNIRNVHHKGITKPFIIVRD
jgi:hypothetical protein